MPLASWCCKTNIIKCCYNPLYQLERDFAVFPEILKTFLYVKRVLATSVVKGIKYFFLTLSQPLPICAYIYLTDESFN